MSIFHLKYNSLEKLKIWSNNSDSEKGLQQHNIKVRAETLDQLISTHILNWFKLFRVSSASRCNGSLILQRNQEF